MDAGGAEHRHRSSRREGGVCSYLGTSRRMDWRPSGGACTATFFVHAGARRGDGVYECDDKCGSFWIALPVDPTGRDSKLAVGFLYRFAIQANVICGAQGLIRFAVVPKFVSTGSNFGLTNLIMTLYRAKRKGRLPAHVKTLYRHTDGGSDNVSIATHILHWLLVYLGIFDEIIWFRFEAGCGTSCARASARAYVAHV